MMTSVLLYSLLLPALAAGAGLMPSLVGQVPRERDWTGAAALTLALWTGVVGLTSWPSLPPVSAREWLLSLVLAAALFGGADAAWRLPGSLRWGGRGLLALLTPLLLLKPLLLHGWSLHVGALWVVGTAAGIALLWWGLDRLVQAMKTSLLALALLLLSGSTMVALLLSGSALLGQIAALGALAILVVGLLSWKRGEPSLLSSALPPFVLLMTGLWIQGLHYSELPLGSALLLLVAPLLLWIGQLRSLGSWRLRRRELARMGAMLLPLAGALLLALSSFLDDSGGYGSY